MTRYGSILLAPAARARTAQRAVPTHGQRFAITRQISPASQPILPGKSISTAQSPQNFAIFPFIFAHRQFSPGMAHPLLNHRQHELR
jgi:hypothetical protein